MLVRSALLQYKKKISGKEVRRTPDEIADQAFLIYCGFGQKNWGMGHSAIEKNANTPKKRPLLKLLSESLHSQSWPLQLVFTFAVTPSKIFFVCVYLICYPLKQSKPG